MFDLLLSLQWYYNCIYYLPACFFNDDFNSFDRKGNTCLTLAHMDNEMVIVVDGDVDMDMEVTVDFNMDMDKKGV